MADKVVLLIVDYHIALTDRRISLLEKIAELKAEIQAAYRRYGRPQEEVWVIAHPVARHT